MPVEPKGPQVGEPTWEVAYLFPPRGRWTEDDYCALDTNRLVELSDGNLEVLPMPSEEHQAIVALLFTTLLNFTAPRGLGKVLFAPLPVRLWEGKFREPDIVFLLTEHSDRRGQKYWQGADLVVEVVSEDDPNRDWNVKRQEYAQAGIAEYWIVDPRDATITVLTLDGPQPAYRVAGKHSRGQQAASVLLPGLTVDVDQVFSQS